MDSFSVESKTYSITDSDGLPEGWEDMELDERIDVLFGE